MAVDGVVDARRDFGQLRAAAAVAVDPLHLHLVVNPQVRRLEAVGSRFRSANLQRAVTTNLFKS